MNAAISVVLVGFVAAVALVVRPPAPPGIAAFAPQAAKPITKAPLGQSSVNGAGAGACTSGQSCARKPKPKPGVVVPTASPSVGPSGGKGVPSALQCYSWPDGSVTQTSDPQSPPCVATWPEQAKGNGGSTSPGVTGTEIRLAVPARTKASAMPRLQPIVDFVNSHFQLYGRKIRLVTYKSVQTDESESGDTTAAHVQDPGAQHADAVSTVALKPFAATDFIDTSGLTSVLPEYAHYLADHKVIALMGAQGPTNLDRPAMAAHAPYEWSYAAPFADEMATTGSLVCAGLKGKRAAHAPSYATKTRTFAIVVPSRDWFGAPIPGLPALRSRLKACGLGDVKVYEDPLNNRQQANTSNMNDARLAGITSMIWLQWPLGFHNDDPRNAAGALGYHPEWIGVAGVANNLAVSDGNDTQLSTTFGVGVWNKLLPLEETPWYEAYTTAGGDPAAGQLLSANALYKSLLMLASGAQLAGPDLTPESFAHALHSTAFPNPGAGAAPFYQGRVGFEDQGTVMMSDFLGWTFHSTGNAFTKETVTYGNPTSYFCYLNLGTRYTDRTWPTDDLFYKGRCA